MFIFRQKYKKKSFSFVWMKIMPNFAKNLCFDKLSNLTTNPM
jgi:hypothetical protein